MSKPKPLTPGGGGNAAMKARAARDAAAAEEAQKRAAPVVAEMPFVRFPRLHFDQMTDEEWDALFRAPPPITENDDAT